MDMFKAVARSLVVSLRFITVFLTTLLTAIAAPVFVEIELSILHFDGESLEFVSFRF